MQNILEKIYQQSPWLLAPEKINNDYHLNTLKGLRYVWKENDFLNHRFEEGVYLLTGPRQIGKSTAVKLLIQKILKARNHRNILYFNCDLLESKQDIVDLVIAFQKEIADASLPIVIALDEITSVKDAVLGIKYLIDTGLGKNVTFLLTGSSTVNLEKTGEYLPGRRGKGKDFVLMPLSFREVVTLVSPEANALLKLSLSSPHFLRQAQELKVKLDLPTLLKGYLIAGGFPKTINEWFTGKTIQPETLNLYRDWIVSEVIKQRRKIEITKMMFDRITRSLSAPVSYHSFIQDMNLGSHNTVHDYLHFFESSFFIEQTYHVDLHQKRVNMRKNKKIYFSDPFIFWVINHWLSAKGSSDFSELSDAVIKSQLVENLVANFLKKKCGELFYYRNAGEIDFIEKSFAVEVKYQNKIIPEDYHALAKLPKLWKKIVISKNTLEHKDDVLIVPAELFLLCF